MKIKKTRKAGSKDSLLNKKVAIRQLSQIGLTNDETNEIYANLATMKIQDRFHEKYLARCKNLLNTIKNEELEMLNTVFTHFVDSVNTTYEFDDKKTPGYLLNIKPMIESAIHQTNMLLDLKKNQKSLEKMFKSIGYNNLTVTIIASINNIKNSIVLLQNFKNIAIDDYRGAELGIETQPAVRNTTERRIDAITRRPRTMRSQAMTRKTRSK